MVLTTNRLRIGAVLSASVLGLLATSAHAGEADVVAVDVSGDRASGYRFDVTVAHADEGWDHYADLWEVRGPDGTVLGSRILHHPHVDEQPFTRSLSGVMIPQDVTRVSVCARDSVHDFGGICMEIDLD